jgi:hypothetical protein
MNITKEIDCIAKQWSNTTSPSHTKRYPGKRPTTKCSGFKGVQKLCTILVLLNIRILLKNRQADSSQGQASGYSELDLPIS